MCQFQPKQTEALQKLFDSKTKYLLYGGAAGGGKSYFLRWAAIALGIYYTGKYGVKDVTIGLFSEDYPTLKDRQIIKIKHEFPNWLGDLRETRDEGLVFKAKEEYGGFMILLRNLDDPSKYASTEFAAVLVEELTKNPVETFEDLRFRLRYPGVPDVKFVGATNPGQVGHAWVKKLWIEPDPNNPDLEQDKFVFVPATVYDNNYIDAEYITQLKSMPEQKRKAWLEGSWDVFEGQVFSEWSRPTHTCTPFEIPKEWKRYIAMDWGVKKPSSIGWYAQDYDGRVYLYKELYLTGLDFERKFSVPLTPKRLARAILANSKEGYEYCVADPSLWNKTILGENRTKPEGESMAEQMISSGLKMIRGDNDRMNGLGRYRQALSIAPDGRPYYIMFSSCYDSCRTIPALVYDETRIEDVDTDGEDHCYDRDRYFFMSRPAAPEFVKKEPEYPIHEYLDRLIKKKEDNENREEELWGEEGDDF